MFFSKKISFEHTTNEQILEAEDKLNKRPRKRFKYETPNYVHSQLM